MRNQRRSASPPNTVNCTVRKYLTAREIEKLMDYARKHSRYGHRDSTMILVTYRHGLRASEVCDLQWHQVELDCGRMHIRRAKNGTTTVTTRILANLVDGTTTNSNFNFDSTGRIITVKLQTKTPTGSLMPGGPRSSGVLTSQVKLRNP